MFLGLVGLVGPWLCREGSGPCNKGNYHFFQSNKNYTYQWITHDIDYQLTQPMLVFSEYTPALTHLIFLSQEKQNLLSGLYELSAIEYQYFKFVC